MGFVTEGLAAIGFIVLVVWLISLFKSMSQDNADAQDRAKQDARTREYAERQAELHRTRETLRCLGCDHQFTGPLSDSGCPHCHLSALVVTEREYKRGRQANPTRARQDKEP